MNFNQRDFDIRLEWGIQGVEKLAPISDVIIIVDILSFSTCVDIATKNGAMIYPYRWKDETAIAYSRKVGAQLADFNRNHTTGFSLSPSSLLNIKCKTKIVLPSPNGSTISLSTKSTPTLCGCLRNAKAVATAAKRIGKNISIIPAGEQWDNKSLRVALEDLIGAGSIISYLDGDLSPESKSGLAIFNDLKSNLLEEVKNYISGKELTYRGFEQDIILSCDFNASDNVPILIDNAYMGQRWVSL